MTAEKSESMTLDSAKKDIQEYIDLLMQLTDEDQRQLRGIMIGMQIAREMDTKSA